MDMNKNTYVHHQNGKQFNQCNHELLVVMANNEYLQQLQDLNIYIKLNF